MNYLYTSLAVAAVGLTASLTILAAPQQQEENCRETRKGSIVATLNCPELPEKQAAAVSRPFDRDKALAQARGASH